MKRIFDFIMAFFGLILIFLPVLVVVALINKFTGNDVFFIQERLGKDLKPFLLIKFATMDKDAHINGDTITCKNDSRVTKIGALLRKSKINELPQLINVLKGDMSLVGPRPLPSNEVSIYPLDVAKKIYSIKPGITGLASLYFHNEESLLSCDKESAESIFRNVIMPKKAKFELWYVDNRKFLLDLKIIFATLLVIGVPRKNILSFISKRLGGSEVQQNAEKIFGIQYELNNEDVSISKK
ncbi:TPA: sugar transferase [Candidatus Poribacteria bacterium]|nr:sugar transferase [Candidatus Poribacteria bacterium]